MGHKHTSVLVGSTEDKQWWVTTIPQCWWGAGQAVVGRNHAYPSAGGGGDPSAGGEQDRQCWVTTIPQCWWGVGQAVVGHNCWWGDLERQAGQAVVGHNHTPCSGS